MNSNTIAIESFITFCDDMMIAEESFSSIKSKIVTLFSKLVLWIESKVKKMKDGKIKSALMKLLSRAKRGLSKSKSLKEHNPELVEKLQTEYKEINEEVREVVKDGDDDYFEVKVNGKVVKLNKYKSIEKYVAEKDIKHLRECIGSIIYTNWDFSKGEFDAAIKYVESKGIKIMDDHLVGDPPISSQKKTFTDDDFARAIFELKKNFCEERIKDVKTIGRALSSKK